MTETLSMPLRMCVLDKALKTHTHTHNKEEIKKMQHSRDARYSGAKQKSIKKPHHRDKMFSAWQTAIL